MSSPTTPPHEQRTGVRRERRLSPVGAVVNAFLNRRLTHYPRFPVADGTWKQLSDRDMIAQVSEGLASLRGNDANLEIAVQRGRETLDEVKALTEYQDQKATRLLTIITFLSALSGILFVRFVEIYPLHVSLPLIELGTWQKVLLTASYAFFAIFAFLAICGALVV